MLRSIRLGEADRVLHVYTQDRGRVGAVAKGVRRTKSRFGARLEPLSHVELMLHQGQRGAADGDRRRADPAAQRRTGGLVPPRGRAGRVGGDAAAVRRAGGEPARIRGVDAVPGRARRVAGNGCGAACARRFGALFPVEAALALRLPAAPDELCGVRCDRCACRLLPAGGWGRVRAVRGGALPLSGDGIRGIEALLGTPLADAQIDKGPAREALGASSPRRTSTTAASA